MLYGFTKKGCEIVAEVSKIWIDGKKEIFHGY